MNECAAGECENTDGLFELVLDYDVRTALADFRDRAVPGSVQPVELGPAGHGDRERSAGHSLTRHGAATTAQNIRFIQNV